MLITAGDSVDRVWDKYFKEDTRRGRSLFSEEREDHVIPVPKKNMSANIMISDINRDNVLATICISPELDTEQNIHWWCPEHIDVAVTLRELTGRIDEVIVTDTDFNHELAVFTPYIKDREVHIVNISALNHISVVILRGDVKEYVENTRVMETLKNTGAVYAK